MFSSYQLGQLATSLERESALHESYIETMQAEQISVIGMKLELCAQLREKREQVCVQISREREKRTQLMSDITGLEVPPRVSIFVREKLAPADQRRFLALIEKLKKVVKKAQWASQEFSQVVNYSLGLVTSNLSIVRSAAHEVQKGYTIHGQMRESILPLGGRSSVTLREA